MKPIEQTYQMSFLPSAAPLYLAVRGTWKMDISLYTTDTTAVTKEKIYAFKREEA